MTYPEELAEARIIRLARPSLHILQILCEPKPQDLEDTIERLVGGADGDKGIRGIEIVPVLKVGSRFQKLRRKGEADVGEVSDANEPIGATVSTPSWQPAEECAAQSEFQGPGNALLLQNGNKCPELRAITGVFFDLVGHPSRSDCRGHGGGGPRY